MWFLLKKCKPQNIVFLLFCPKFWHAKLDSREQPAILDGKNVFSVFAGQTPKHVFLSVFLRYCTLFLPSSIRVRNLFQFRMSLKVRKTLLLTATECAYRPPASVYRRHSPRLITYRILDTVACKSQMLDNEEPDVIMRLRHHCSFEVPRRCCRMMAEGYSTSS